MNRNSLDECRLQIGDVCCSLRFKDPAYSTYFNNHFKGFISENDPDLIIDINIDLKTDQISMRSSDLLKPGEHIFYLKSNIGIINLEDRQCTMFFSAKGRHDFKEFIFMMYYSINKHKNIKNNFLIHSCAVAKNGYGYLFAGRPESGKSTIAKLSTDYRILNDEIVIVKKENGNYKVASSPFRGDFMENENDCVPLKTIFLIKHELGKNRIRKIRKSEFITAFINEVIFSQSVQSTKEDAFREMMDFCENIAEEIPYYELQFLPNKTFWIDIEQMDVAI